MGHIRHVRVIDRRLDPAETELWIAVDVEGMAATAEVRGRLMGPRCAYATTVEVAYPLRPLPPGRGAGAEHEVVGRVVIPEPSFWDPQSPFLYEGPVELWEGGRRVDQATVDHGLRSLTLGPRGFRLNGKPISVRGAACDGLSEADAGRLRAAGFNTLLVPVRAGDRELWSRADRLGFLVLGRITDPAGVEAARALRGHACCLGWVAPPGVPAAGLGMTGVEWEPSSGGDPAAGAAFTMGEPLAGAGPSAPRLPRLLRLAASASPPAVSGDGVLGWVTNLP